MNYFYKEIKEFNDINIEATVLYKDNDSRYVVNNSKVNNEVDIDYRAYLYTQEKLSSGQVIKINGDLVTPKENRNIGGINYKNVYLSNYVSKIIYANDIEVIDKKYSIYSVRSLVQNKVDDKKASYINAILFGDKSGISNETKEIFANSGISHILAISGLHIGVVLALLLFLLKKRSYLMQFYIMTPIMLMLIIITGFSPSAIRACIMCVIYLYAKCFGHRYSMLNSLFLTMIILLITNPYYVYNVGFVLSTSATLSIGIYYKKIESILGFIKIEWVKKSVAMYLSCQIVPLPFMLLYFNKFAIYGIFANLIAVPLITISLIFAIIGILLYKITFFSSIFLSISGEIIEIIEKFAIKINSFNGIIYTSDVNIVLLLVFICVIIFIVIIRRINKRVLFIPVFIGLLCFVNFNAYSKESYLYMADVGDAMSLHIRTQNNKHIIIDGGKNSYDMISYLRSIGAKDLILINTHDDFDHYGGFFDISKEFNITHYYSSVLFGDKTYNSLIKSMEKIPKDTLRAGDTLQIDNVYMEIIHPTYIGDNKNGNSLNMYITINDKSILITGDIDKKSEIKYRNVDVLQVPHHGSKNNTSEDMIKDTNAKINLVSASKLDSFQGGISTKDYGGIKLIFGQEISMYGVVKK